MWVFGGSKLYFVYVDSYFLKSTFFVVLKFTTIQDAKCDCFYGGRGRGKINFHVFLVIVYA